MVTLTDFEKFIILLTCAFLIICKISVIWGILNLKLRCHWKFNPTWYSLNNPCFTRSSCFERFGVENAFWDRTVHTILLTRVWSRSWLAPKSINMRLVSIYSVGIYHISTIVYSPAKSIIYRLGFKIAGKADFPTLKLDYLRHMTS